MKTQETKPEMTAPLALAPCSAAAATMFGRTILVGDYVHVRFPWGRFYGEMEGTVLELKRLRCGKHEGRLPCGLWFQESDELLNHKPNSK